jgi:hypothetical protein
MNVNCVIYLTGTLKISFNEKQLNMFCICTIWFFKKTFILASLLKFVLTMIVSVVIYIPDKIFMKYWENCYFHYS